ALTETSLIAVPIESYGERAGVLQISKTEGSFSADDIDFAQSVAERLGAISHIHGLTRIAQEGHRAAEELARREVDARARFEAVLESAPIGIAVISADELRFEMANPRWFDFAKRVGRATDETTLAGLYVPDVVPGFERDLIEVAERGETQAQDALEFRTAGQSHYFNIVVSPVRGRFTGTTQSLTVLVQDVTDQVRAKREIEALAQMMEERSARLDSILGSMTDALWVFNAQGEVVDVNQAALAMFGLASRSEAIARGMFAGFDLRYSDGRPIPSDDLPHARALRGETIPDHLALGRHLITGQDVDLSIAVAPIASKSIVGAVLVARDITALQELDRKKDEFLSVASHELRTPLTTIKGYAQLLSTASADIGESERTAYLRSVLGEVERMMRLISELLDVSRIETNRLQLHRADVRWIDFVQAQVSSFQFQDQKREMTFRAYTDDVALRVDADRMRQVLDNLISNALKYSADETPIHVAIRATPRSIETSVIDRGIGIPKDELLHLFERFHRARNVSSRYYGGLGLGLYIASAIVQAHGGEIWVESVEGEGSTFTISLPRE
ncbi:MAG TPA: ATP-binding protein, partial [Thermoanaerobaculia bacterium]